MDLRCEELVGVEVAEGEEQGEFKGVRGYLDLLGELRQYLMVLSQTCEAASTLFKGPVFLVTNFSSVSRFEHQVLVGSQNGEDQCVVTTLIHKLTLAGKILLPLPT